MMARITLEKRQTEAGTQLRLIATSENAERLLATFNVWPRHAETFIVSAWLRPKGGASVDAVINACSFLDSNPLEIEVPDTFFLPAAHAHSAE